MTNHIHGILIIPEFFQMDNSMGNGDDNRMMNGDQNPMNHGDDNGMMDRNDNPMIHANAVQTLHATSLAASASESENESESPSASPKKMAGISPKSGSISTIIRSYKSAITFHCNRLGFEFAWQTRFTIT
ncbi:MAG: hypothetical protein ACK40G_01055 [Cytophagaceae bacterium]